MLGAMMGGGMIGGGMMGAPGMMPGQQGMMQPPRPPGSEMPTPADLPPDAGDDSQNAILAAILGGSALIGLAIGCTMFRKKKGRGGDSDSDADSDDESDGSDSS